MSIPELQLAENGFYYVHWTEGRRSKRVSTRTKDLAAAKAFYGQWLLMEREAPVALPGQQFTVSDMWVVYNAKHIQKKLAAPETLEINWRNLEPHFGGLTVTQVNQDSVDEYIRKRTRGLLGRKVKPQTVRKELSALVACMNFCAMPKQRMIEKRHIEPIELPEAGEPRDRWLRMEEMQRLLNAARTMRRGERLSRLERFLWLALETAGRKQALLELTWDRVDFQTRTIHLDVPGRKKTKKRRADVSISAALLPILERAHTERISDHVLDNQGAIWASVQHAAIKAGFSKQEVAASAKPKATGISPHVLRHTAATHMARNGVPLWKIAKTLGNTMAMVEKVYAKWQPDDPAGTVNHISAGVLEAAE